MQCDTQAGCLAPRAQPARLLELLLQARWAQASSRRCRHFRSCIDQSMQGHLWQCMLKRVVAMRRQVWLPLVTPHSMVPDVSLTEQVYQLLWRRWPIEEKFET